MTEANQGIVPHLVVDDATAALAFYARAFGAKEVMRHPAEDGKRLMHAEIELNGGRLLLRDHFPEYQGKTAGGPPKLLGGTPVTLHLDVPNCDAAIDRAVAAGATILMAPMDAFWGMRYGQILDPFGHAWSFASPLGGSKS